MRPCLPTGPFALEYVVRGPELGVVLPDADMAALESTVRALCRVWNGPGALLMTVDAEGVVHESLEPSIASLAPERILVCDAVGAPALEGLNSRWPGRVTPFDADALNEEMHPWWLVAAEFRSGGTLRVPRPAEDDDDQRVTSIVLWGLIEPGDEGVIANRLRIEDEQRFAFGLLRDQVLRSSPLEWAARCTEYHEHLNGLSQLVLVVLEEKTNFYDLVNFWNMRARYGRRRDACTVLGAPAELVGDPDAAELIARWAVECSWATKPDVRVSVKKELAEPVKQWLLAGGMTFVEGDRWTSFSSVPESRARPEFAITLSSIPQRLRRGRGTDALVNLTEGVTPVHLPAPEGLPGSVGWNGITRVEISGVPVAFPMSDQLASACVAGAIGRGRRAITATVEPPISPLRLQIGLPSADVQLERHMQSVGLRASPSSAAKIAQPLIGRLHDAAGLDALAVTCSADVLSALTSPSRVKLARRVRNELASAGVSEVDESKLVEMLRDEGLFAQLQSLTSHQIASALNVKVREILPALQALSDTGYLRRGFEIDCPQCATKEFWALRELDEHMRCRACRIEFPLPAVSGARETPMSYRLDGLVARAMDQDLVAVLLTLRCLLRLEAVSADALWWPGLDLYEADATSNSFEVDLLVASDATIWVCEAKANAGALTREDALGHIRWSARIGGTAVFSAIEGDWREETLNLVDDHRCLFFGRASLLDLGAS